MTARLGTMLCYGLVSTSAIAGLSCLHLDANNTLTRSLLAMTAVGVILLCCKNRLRHKFGDRE